MVITPNSFRADDTIAMGYPFDITNANYGRDVTCRAVGKEVRVH